MAVSPPAYGYEEVFGIAKETTFGTGVNPDVWWRPVSNSLRTKDGPLPLAQASGVTVPFYYAAGTLRGFRGMPDVSGTVVVEAEYDDIGHIFNNAVGTATTTDNTGTNNGYEHLFEVAYQAGNMPSSWTIARINGAGDAYRFVGCMVNTLEISSAENRIVTVSMDIVGQAGSQAADAIGTLSAAQFIEMHHSYCRRENAVGTQPDSDDNLDDGNDCADWTFRLENNLRVQQAAGYGVRGTRPLIYSGHRRATLTFNKDWFDDTFYDVINNTTIGSTVDSISVYCDSGTDIDVGGQNYDLEIWLPAAVLVERDDSYGGGGDVIPETVTYEAGFYLGTGDNNICHVILNNNTSAY